MIKGLSEIRRIRRIGKVRLGEKKISQGGKEYPSALDHFSFVDAPDLLKMYGPACKEIDIIIPNENVDAFFPQLRKCYRSSGLFCSGDGESAMRVNVGLSDGDKNSKAVAKGQPLDPEGHKFIQFQGIKAGMGDMFSIPCLGEACHFTERKFCKPIGRFLFLVPNSPRIGVYEISTSSFNSIVELNSAIETIRGLAGRISMIPLKLRLVPKETKVPKTAMKKTIHHLVLEYLGTMESLVAYRDAKQIPDAALPKRHELEQHIPEDLMPDGGAKLDGHLAGEDKIAGPEAKEAEIMPPSKGESNVTIQGVSKVKQGFKVKGELDYFTAEEAFASAAKKLMQAGEEARITWERRDGLYWIADIGRVSEGF